MTDPAQRRHEDLGLGKVALARRLDREPARADDAASAYDPVSAQGIVKALCDGEAAADAIAGFLAGAGEVPLLKYQDGVFARFTDYLRLRQHLYGLEQRWPHASFWQNRLR